MAGTPITSDGIRNSDTEDRTAVGPENTPYFGRYGHRKDSTITTVRVSSTDFPTSSGFNVPSSRE